jgi:hypothetical protein
MARPILSVTAAVFVLAASSLVLGCAKSQAATSVGSAVQASPASARWVSVVHLGGGLTGPNRGNSFVDFDTVGGSVRIVVTAGAAPGWGVKVPRLRYWLGPVTNGQVPPPDVPLHATITTRGDTKHYDLRSTEPVMPGTYQLLYQGAGWYGMTVYVSATK